MAIQFLHNVIVDQLFELHKRNYNPVQRISEENFRTMEFSNLDFFSHELASLAQMNTQPLK